MTSDINQKYSQFYRKRNPDKVYPTEFVVRTFLAQYPHLNFTPAQGNKILDLGFGDGRNTSFLAEQGYDTYGTEITNEIVSLTEQRLEKNKLQATLKVGRNSNIPFADKYFDIVLACHSSYYCDEHDSFQDNLSEISRVLKTSGWFITSLVSTETYLYKNAKNISDGHAVIVDDPYNNRIGYKMKFFENIAQIEKELSDIFTNFSFGTAFNNYYGIDERVFWVVCQKK